jgi:hypothetical protein
MKKPTSSSQAGAPQVLMPMMEGSTADPRIALTKKVIATRTTLIR